jgi:hypothetical protein
MRKAKISLVALAMILGVGGALSVKANSTQSGLAWFYESDGTRVTTLIPQCSESDNICAREYTLDDQNQPDQPTGNTVQGNKQ